MTPHQHRVLTEREELDSRRERLNAFFATDTFSQLDPAEQDRMKRQASAMESYSRVLSERIAVFSESL